MICNVSEKISEELILNRKTLILTLFRNNMIIGKVCKESSFIGESDVLFLDGVNDYPLFLKELKDNHVITVTYSKEKNVYVGKVFNNLYGDKKNIVLSEGKTMVEVLESMNQKLVSKENKNVKAKIDYLEIRLREMASVGSFYGITKKEGLLYGKWLGYQNNDYYIRTKDSYISNAFLENYPNILDYLNNDSYLFLGFTSSSGYLNARLSLCMSDKENERILHECGRVCQVSDTNIFNVLEKLENNLVVKDVNTSLVLNRKG